MVDPDVPKSQGGAGAHQIINVTLSSYKRGACRDASGVWPGTDGLIWLILFHSFGNTC